MTTNMRAFSTRENMLIGSLSRHLTDNGRLGWLIGIEDPEERYEALMQLIQMWLMDSHMTFAEADPAEASSAMDEWFLKTAERDGEPLHVTVDGHRTDMTLEDFAQAIMP